jgi:hypothetical protein
MKHFRNPIFLLSVLHRKYNDSVNISIFYYFAYMLLLINLCQLNHLVPVKFICNNVFFLIYDIVMSFCSIIIICNSVHEWLELFQGEKVDKDVREGGKWNTFRGCQMEYLQH